MGDPPEVEVYFGDARSMREIPSAAVGLVLTSPPYPMIAMWDELFEGEGARSFGQMHGLLDGVWREAARVLVPGGLACVVVGDALRTVDGEFRLYANHARVIQAFETLGFTSLPYILWKKPTNRPNAFLGSGFLPPNAYVTLDCEFVLVFRKGGLRRFPKGDPTRADSRYTKPERDVWFSQIWQLKGSRQVRSEFWRRTASFPSEVPRRLISMFSVKGDLVLDPFAGTGTTLAQAVLLGRRAVGYEIDPSLGPVIEAELAQAGARAVFRGAAQTVNPAGGDRAVKRGRA